MDGGAVNCWDMGRKVLGGEVDGVPNVGPSVAAVIVDEEQGPLRQHSPQYSSVVPQYCAVRNIGMKNEVRT